MKALEKGNETEQIPVMPVEDLMREHGLLRRLLLVYEELAVNPAQDIAAEAIGASAHIVQRFINRYHEKLEEDYLFPLFREDRLQVGLVATLLSQHDAGRRITADIIRLSDGTNYYGPEESRCVVTMLREFVRMYRPHAAREDTILYPDFKKIISKNEYEKLGDVFEDKERALFGEGGFESVLKEVEHIEKTLGLYDLSQFTPPARTAIV